MKTSGLTGTALDWAVAKCEGYTATIKPTEIVYAHPNEEWHHNGNWQPSSKWVQGGPIIEREQIDIEWVGSKQCLACTIDLLDEEYFEAFGTTPLEAAMRCFVALKLGDEIDIPKELL